MSSTPALDYVLVALERDGDLLTKTQRAALLSLGVRAERDLNHARGYDLTYADLVAKDIGLAVSTTRRALDVLVDLELVVAVVNGGRGRELVSGPLAKRRGPAIGYRLVEDAFA
jgi:hypothetical protein